ncbi:Anaerobic regulatory protein [Roseibium album]|nr:Anaerobic regulatory protein [Roseibium album]
MITIMRNEIITFLVSQASNRFTLEKESNLFRQGDTVRSLFVIERGLIELTRHQLDGRPVVLQRAAAHMVVAEASLYSSTYHCDAIVCLEADIASISKSTVERLMRVDEKFSNMWSEYLAREVQSARSLIEILSRKTVSERLDGWLAWRDNESVTKGQWKNVAAQIGVSPEALYRELAKRRLK